MIKNDSIHTICYKNNGSGNQVVKAYSPQRYSLLAFQTIISALLNLLHLPLTLLTFLCILPGETNQYQITINSLLFSGVATILQATVGIKFPVLMSPSNLFISGFILYLKSPFWEQYTNGDLYAMGSFLRNEEFTNRSGELRGVLIIGGFGFLIICGMFWHLPIKLPSATIRASLITISLSNINQILVKNEMSLFSILVFSLSLVFYSTQNIKIPFSDKINNDGFYVNFKQFSVLLSSIIVVAINNNSENENKNLLDRAIASHQWYSLSLPIKDFVLPKLSARSLVLLPTFCSQVMTSYCCFRTLNKEKEIYLKALLLEIMLIVVLAMIGVIVPPTVDPISIGLLQMTNVKHTESSVIAGGLLVLFSILFKMIVLFSYIPYPILCGINLFLYGQLLEKGICKGLKELDSDRTESSIIAMSVLSGLVLQVFSSIPVGIERNLIYSIAVLIIKSPVLITFVMSVILAVVFQIFNKN